MRVLVCVYMCGSGEAGASHVLYIAQKILYILRDIDDIVKALELISVFSNG